MMNRFAIGVSVAALMVAFATPAAAQEAAQKHFNGDFRGNKAYLCGPPLMIEACIATLMQGRLFERDIYTEKFISAADAQQVRSPLFKSI